MDDDILSKPVRFNPGSVCSTPGALENIPPIEMSHALRRHIRGDWGELDAHDVKANESALMDGGRLLSAYVSSSGTKFWIITEADRSSTTVLLPEEY